MMFSTRHPIIKMFGLLAIFLVGCDKTPPDTVFAQSLEDIHCKKDQSLGNNYDCVKGYGGKPFTGLEIAGNPEGRFRISQLLDGKYHGFSFSASGDKLLSVGWYRGGAAEGYHLDYHLDTQKLRQQTEYANGKVVTKKNYDEQGIITSFYRYDGDASTNNAIESISYEKGRPWNHRFVQDGEKRQRWLRYFANGQVKKNSVVLPEQSLQTLSETEYYSNGNVKIQYNFDREANTAIQHTYTFNGTRTSEQHYIYPGVKPHGRWLFFCESNEQIRGIEDYVNGVKQGVSEGYHCNGQLEYRKHYKDGKITDLNVDKFDENGKLYKREYFYDSGERKREEYFDEQGQLIATYHYK